MAVKKAEEREVTMKRKITVRDVYGEVKRPDPDAKTKYIIEVCGHVDGWQEGEDKFKPGQKWSALLGNFEAINLDTGEVFVAPKAFIPEPLHSLMITAIKEQKGATLAFACQIGYKPSKTAIGYEYEVKPVASPAAADLLADLRNLLPSQKKLLKAG